MNMRTLLPLLSFLFFTYQIAAQCPSQPIDQNLYKIIEVDSEDATFNSALAIDGDPNTYWRTNGAQPFPHQIQIDLGAVYAVNQMTLLPRQDVPNGKLSEYEVYLSMDGNSWGMVQAKGKLPYVSADDVALKSINFGAVDARFIRLVGFSNEDDSNDITRMLIAELTVGQAPCGATGQSNQHINFSPIPRQLTTAAPFPLWATSSSGLPVSYEVVSGTASVNGNMVTPGNVEGPVVLRAFQQGDATYYPTETFQVFQLIDPDRYSPTLTSRITDAFPIEMASLNGYPLYANATISYPDLLTIEGIDFEIDGIRYSAQEENGAYLYWWLPSNYGDHTIRIIAKASNGKTAEKVVTVTVDQAQNDRTMMTLENTLIDYNSTSRTFVGTYQLPQFTGSYDQIYANFWVECPNVPGGCDDWDRLAYVQLKAPNGQWIEFVRYITPYGIGCAHYLDLTDYASLLQGEVEIRLFIDTWGTGGWNVNLQLNYERGQPEYLYSKVDVLWEGNFPFGDPANLQPLDTLSYHFPENTAAAKLVLFTTGHGWGDNNTLNAAEFYHARHHIEVDGAETFEQNLWVNCSPNPDACNGQLGNWQSNRAGWCPGILAPKYEYDLLPYISRDSLSLAYVFQKDYIDLCHPNHPDCVTGVTCSNCNDGYNPQYQIRGHLISYTNASLASSAKDLKSYTTTFQLYPNPSTGQVHLEVQEAVKGAIQVQLQSMDGKVLRQYHFDHWEDLLTTTFDWEELAGATYLVKVITRGEAQFLKWVKY